MNTDTAILMLLADLQSTIVALRSELAKAKEQDTTIDPEVA